MVDKGVPLFSVCVLGGNKPNRRTPPSIPAHEKAPTTTPKLPPPPHKLAKTQKSELLQIASSGATRNALTKGSIESIEIQVPPIDDQLKIAAPIRNINLQIDNLNKTNGHLYSPSLVLAA